MLLQLTYGVRCLRVMEQVLFDVKTQIILVNMFFSFLQHLVSLLVASDMEVVLSVLGVLYVFRYVTLYTVAGTGCIHLWLIKAV